MGRVSVPAEARADVKVVEFQAVVIRADGTREDLGTVAYYHRNPLRRLLWRLSKGGGR